MLSSSSSDDLSEKENTPPTESTPLPSNVGNQPSRNERIADWLENQPDITIQPLQTQEDDEENPEREIVLTAVSESSNENLDEGSDSDETIVSEDAPFDPEAYLAEKQSERQEVPVTKSAEPRAETQTREETQTQEEALPALSLIGSSVFDNSIEPIKMKKMPKLDVNYLNRLARGEQPESSQSNRNNSRNQGDSSPLQHKRTKGIASRNETASSAVQNSRSTSENQSHSRSVQSRQNDRSTSRNSSPDSSLAGSRLTHATKKKRVKWSLEEDEKLKKGFARYGKSWVVIKKKYFRQRFQLFLIWFISLL